MEKKNKIKNNQNESLEEKKKLKMMAGNGQSKCWESKMLDEGRDGFQSGIKTLKKRNELEGENLHKKN